MRNRCRNVFRQMQKQVAAQSHVQQLHADSDAENWQLHVDDQLHQFAIVYLAASIHWANGGVQHKSVETRI